MTVRFTLTYSGIQSVPGDGGGGGGIRVSYTNEANPSDITEILLKVFLKTYKPFL